MYTKSELLKIIIADDPTRVRRVQLTSSAVEVGSNKHHVHAHFNLSIEHGTFVRLKGVNDDDERTINRTTMQWFDEHLEPRTGRKCYASVKLAESSRFKNYAVKHGHPVEGFRVERKDRSSDTRPGGTGVASRSSGQDDDE